MEITPQRRSSVLWESTLDLIFSWSPTRLSTRKALPRWNQVGTRSVNSSIGSLMIATSLSPPKGTCVRMTTGCRSISSEASSMALSPRPQPICSSQWSAASPSSDDSQFRCSPWPTSWTGAMFGATRTGGDAPRKSLSHTRSSAATVASSPWNENIHRETELTKATLQSQLTI